MRKNILVVCTGNTCRSPVVEAVLARRLNADFETDWVIRSAGTKVLDGEPASPYGVEALMAKEGIGIDHHRSKKVTQELIDRSDLIICMAERHRSALIDQFQIRERPIHLLTEFVSDEDGDVTDPFGGNREAYVEMVETVTRLIDRGLPKIRSATIG